MDAQRQFDLLTRNAAEVVPRDDLLVRLASGRPLRVKHGVDPTAPHVHLGWAVPLRKLRQFQELGHVAVLVVGDFTARIGDPSGQDKTRPMLSKAEVDRYAASVLEQIRTILLPERLEVRRNSQWLEPLGTQGVLELASHYTVARTLERDDFARRLREGSPITIREFLYPLLQAYDSVAVEADVEIGGSDQHFTFMVARHIQRAYGQPPQVAMTFPLLEGTDGVHKMSQSLGNYVAITDPPPEIFGKLMRIPDGLVGKYLRLTTSLKDDEVARIEELPPAEAKRRLAEAVVALYHGAEAAAAARAEFDRVFRDRAPPADVPSTEIPASCVEGGVVYVPRLLKELGLVPSSSEGRRLIAQGGLDVDGKVLLNESVGAAELRGRVLKVGKRRFVRLR